MIKACDNSAKYNFLKQIKVNKIKSQSKLNSKQNFNCGVQEPKAGVLPMN